MIPNINIRKAESFDAKLLSNIIRASHMDVAEKFNLTIKLRTNIFLKSVS